MPHIDVTLRDKEKNSALDIATCNNNIDLLKALLNKIDPNNRKHIKAVKKAYKLTKVEKNESTDETKKLLKDKLPALKN